MTTTQTEKKTTNGNASAHTVAPKAEDKGTAGHATTATAAATATEEPKREASKVYLVVGEIREFKNAAEAEKFLNTDPAAPKEFSVIKGKKIEKKQKVSLR